MDTLADYEKWEATRQTRLQQWLQNPDSASVAAEPDQTSELLAQAFLCAAIGIAVYLAFRYRLGIKSAVKFIVVAAIICVVKVMRYIQQEASDIRTQISLGLQSNSREGRIIGVAKQGDKTGRMRLAGRMFFNLAIAPLLLVGALIGVAVLASRLGLLE
jgi:hypothetical protein